MNWYVVNITGGFEQKIKNTIETTDELRNKWTKVIVPVISKKKFYKDRLYNYAEKLYPGYVFISCKDEDYDAVFSVVSGLPGILNMSSMKNVRCIEKRIDENEMLSVLDLISNSKSGHSNDNEKNIFIDDRVKVVDGPFSNFQGIIQDIHKASNKETKVKVCTSFFNSEVTTIVIPLSQVELLN